MSDTIHPGMGIRCVLARIERPEPHTDWPDRWWQWSVVQEAHRTAAMAHMASLPSYRGPKDGRGVVIAGGGLYLPGVWVTLHLLRRVGCTLPVEVWYLGRKCEMPAAWAELLQDIDGVTLHDADQVAIYDYARFLDGFQLKLYSVLHAAFREVLYLDADCYPVVDPTPLFDDLAYRNCGAAFWPDVPTSDTWTNWGAFRCEPFDIPPLETGVFVVDRQACHQQLQLARWYNEHSDATYHWDYGDKGPMRVGFARHKTPVACYEDPRLVTVDTHSFLRKGPDGAVWFVHRVADKPRLVPCVFQTTTQFHLIQQPCAHFPREDWFFEALDALRRHADHDPALVTGLRPVA